MPASAPKPTALTKMIATITWWNERHSAMKSRIGHVSHGGMRLRAARSPIGSESRMPEHRGDDRDLERLVEPAHHELHLVGRDVGREHARDEARALLETDDEALPRDVEYRRGVDDVGGERDPRQPRRPVRRETRRARRRRCQPFTRSRRSRVHRLTPASPRRRRSACRCVVGQTAGRAVVDDAPAGHADDVRGEAARERHVVDVHDHGYAARAARSTPGAP